MVTTPSRMKTYISKNETYKKMLVITET